MRITALILLAWLGGCASLLAPSAQTCEFVTVPAGQTIHVDGQPMTTPAAVPLSTDTGHTVKWPDGSTSAVERSFQPWVIGNAIFGLLALITIPVDIISGASGKNLSPRKIEWREGTGVVKPVQRDYDEDY